MTTIAPQPIDEILLAITEIVVQETCTARCAYSGHRA